ncbi:MAG: response regulator [Flavobacterium sp.]
MVDIVQNQKKSYRILIVDDHRFIIEGYKNAITRYKPEEFHFEITQASDCESAYQILMNSDTPDFDIVFLDISMPAYEAMQIDSGEDLAKIVNERMPECKVVLLTMYSELLKIKTIIGTINPIGLVIKNDLTFDELLFAFDKIIYNETYYSASVVKMLNLAEADAIEIDLFDEQILFHLSKGTFIKDMVDYIPISVGAIERRIINLKNLLQVENNDYSALVLEAKNKGLLF